MSVEEIVSAIVAAHGGRALLEEADSLETEIFASGFLFNAKRRAALDHVRMTARRREPRCAFHENKF